MHDKTTNQGFFIQNARIELNLTQDQLATYLNRSPGLIANWEAEEKNISRDDLAKIERLLEKEAVYI